MSNVRLFFIDASKSGTIPSELGNLKRVDIFFLHKNRLTGSIPAEVFNGEMGKKVQWLVLSENQLTGSLPEQALMGLRNVKLFSLDHNRLTGTIPSTLRYMTSLGKFSRNFEQLFLCCKSRKLSPADTQLTHVAFPSS